MTETPIPQGGYYLDSIVLGPDKNLWFILGGAVVQANPSVPTSPPVLLPTTTYVVVQPNPATVGRPISFTAVVLNQGPALATGTVTFIVDGTVEAPVPLFTVVPGTSQASISSPALAEGTHRIDAVYSGDARFASSRPPAPTTFVVAPPAATTTTLTASPNPATVGHPITLTADVSPQGAGGGTPTGTVTFSVDGTPEAPVTLAFPP